MLRYNDNWACFHLSLAQTNATGFLSQGCVCYTVRNTAEMVLVVNFCGVDGFLLKKYEYANWESIYHVTGPLAVSWSPVHGVCVSA